MPEPCGYWRVARDGEVLLGFGSRVLFCFDEQDLGMGNLAVVALTQAGAKGKRVAEPFGLSPVYVSRLRGRAADGGSRALVAPRGAPRKLSEAACRRAVKLAEDGVSGAEIARRMGSRRRRSAVFWLAVSARRRPAAELELAFEGEGERAAGVEQPAQPAGADDERAAERSAASAPAGPSEPAVGGGRSAAVAVKRTAALEPIAPVERLGEVKARGRYAGAMLPYPFLDRLGAGEALGALPSAAARRYDAAALILAASFGFALGSGSLEQTKRLHPPDAGALIGLQAFPSPRTLRPGLAGLARACDPLAV